VAITQPPNYACEYLSPVSKAVGQKEKEGERRNGRKEGTAAAAILASGKGAERMRQEERGKAAAVQLPMRQSLIGFARRGEERRVIEDLHTNRRHQEK
jgi:hypothetical protein